MANHRIEAPDNLDFESYINNYQGRTRINRALFIAQHCDSLEIEAYKFALNEIKETTKNVKQYKKCVEALNLALRKQNLEPIELDQDWITNTKKDNKARLEQLDAALKTYKNSLIKESIRVTQTGLGDFYFSCGENGAALKNYIRARDYCATSQHVLEMCFNMIKANLEEQHYTHVQTYIARAESTSNLADRPEMMAKLKCYQALALLKGSEPKKFYLVANTLSQIAFDAQPGEVLSPNDVAIYGGLCALASFDRRQLQELITNNATFKNYLELEPQIREMILAFCESKYAASLELLQGYRNDLMLDLYLCEHVDTLIQQIREKAMVQYCVPYSSVDMHRMAAAFNISVDQLENDLISLINGDHGRIEARIDSNRKILCTKRPELRKKVFKQALDAGDNYELAAKALMLRMNLLKADMIVR
ncbi:cop9 signalosome complex subunit [Apophysomyces ossiformis]|uniref:Cop9 signalosome complex subunit n=1 Tax=Apophysomyces ossiformis TaxID=679940 RepID=A0A8H7BNH1_9FUNG|nr:cop9 signalosome complex subunit [Apophysomyces ossiformis]